MILWEFAEDGKNLIVSLLSSVTDLPFLSNIFASGDLRSMSWPEMWSYVGLWNEEGSMLKLFKSISLFHVSKKPLRTGKLAFYCYED